MDDFVSMRLSQIDLRNMDAKKARLLEAKDEKQERQEEKKNPLKFLKESTKENEYFEKMSDHEKMRLYTRLCVENGKMIEENKALKTEFIILKKQNDGVAEQELVELKARNAKLRITLK